jgi:metallo-beta-lactamase family protein
MFVGYQSKDSLGRRLVDGHKLVSIFGDKIAVKAQIRTLGGFSAHAGQSDLLNWIQPLATFAPRIILSHGEPRAQLALAQLLQQRFGLEAATPETNDSIEL